MSASKSTPNSSTHWFHRNLLKFTALQEFNCESTCKGPLAQKIINDVKMARFDLLNSIFELYESRENLMKKYELYVSLIKGVCDPGSDFCETSVPTENNAGNSTGQIQEPGQATNQTKPKNSKIIKVSPRYYFGFKWTDSLDTSIDKNSKNPKSLDRIDAYYDLTSVTILVAIYLSKLANRVASQPDTTMEDAKEIHTCLKLAGSMFKFTKENLISFLKDSVSLEHQSWSDLDPRILETYSIQCQAELLEVTIARAIKMGHKPHLIASLSQDCQKLFKHAFEKLDSTNDEDEKKVEKWQYYLTLKQQIYSAIAYGYYGFAIKGDDKMSGYATGYLASAVSILKIAKNKHSKSYNKTAGAGSDCKPNEHPFFYKITEDIGKMHKETDQERQMVYGMPLPNEGALPDPSYKNEVGKLYAPGFTMFCSNHVQNTHMKHVRVRVLCVF